MRHLLLSSRLLRCFKNSLIGKWKHLASKIFHFQILELHKSNTEKNKILDDFHTACKRTNIKIEIQ